MTKQHSCGPHQSELDLVLLSCRGLLVNPKTELLERLFNINFAFGFLSDDVVVERL